MPPTKARLSGPAYVTKLLASNSMPSWSRANPIRDVLRTALTNFSRLKVVSTTSIWSMAEEEPIHAPMEEAGELQDRLESREEIFIL